MDGSPSGGCWAARCIMSSSLGLLLADFSSEEDVEAPGGTKGSALPRIWVPEGGAGGVPGTPLIVAAQPSAPSDVAPSADVGCVASDYFPGDGEEQQEQEEEGEFITKPEALLYLERMEKIFEDKVTSLHSCCPHWQLCLDLLCILRR